MILPIIVNNSVIIFFLFSFLSISVLFNSISISKFGFFSNKPHSTIFNEFIDDFTNDKSILKNLDLDMKVKRLLNQIGRAHV